MAPTPPEMLGSRPHEIAVVAELVDAPDSGSGDLTIVGVRLSPTALKKFAGL